VEGVRKDQIKEQDLIWRPSWESWRQAKVVPGLFAPPELQEAPSASPAPVLTTVNVSSSPVRQAQRHSAETTSARRNYFIRHWQGELSLPVTYWIDGFLASVFASFVVAVFLEINRPRPNFFALTLLMFVLLVALPIWQVVGIWRSANRYEAKGKVLWAGLAKLSVLVGVARLVWDFTRAF